MPMSMGGIGRKDKVEGERIRNNLQKIKSVYYCTECGYQSAKWLGRCPLVRNGVL